ncbi:MAG: hypothetical protein MRY63_06055 [Neomegalonema sp.]|nr:hypothetical protein [Neomegalonema sp.]
MTNSEVLMIWGAALIFVLLLLKAVLIAANPHSIGSRVITQMLGGLAVTLLAAALFAVLYLHLQVTISATPCENALGDLLGSLRHPLDTSGSAPALVVAVVGMVALVSFLMRPHQDSVPDIAAPEDDTGLPSAAKVGIWLFTLLIILLMFIGMDGSFAVSLSCGEGGVKFGL